MRWRHLPPRTRPRGARRYRRGLLSGRRACLRPMRSQTPWRPTTTRLRSGLPAPPRASGSRRSPGAGRAARWAALPEARCRVAAPAARTPQPVAWEAWAAVDQPKRAWAPPRSAGWRWGQCPRGRWHLLSQVWPQPHPRRQPCDGACSQATRPRPRQASVCGGGNRRCRRLSLRRGRRQLCLMPSEPHCQGRPLPAQRWATGRPSQRRSI